MTNEEYHAAEGISASDLKLLEESPLHLDNKHLFRHESQAKDIGSLCHALVLEPNIVADEFVIMPKFNLRTNAGKDDKEAFITANIKKTIVERDDFDTAQRMAENVRKICGGLLENGVAEASHFADDDGLIVKCRPDYRHQQAGITVDLKTIADVSEYGIKKSIAEYRYDRQQAHYSRTLRLKGETANDFIFVFVGKSAPHLVKIRKIDGYAIEKADYEVERLLQSYREFKQTGAYSAIKTITPFGDK